MQKNKISFCGDLVRTHDADQFLISLFSSVNVREDLWALFAFNHEISKTRNVVSESALGLIRLQWWREAIEGIYENGDVPEHEVLKPLESAIKLHNLPREHFDKLIYAREFDLEDVQPFNIEGLMNYADFTTEPLLKLAVQIAGGNSEVEVIQPVAINYTLAGILRATQYYARQNRFFIPEDLMSKYGVTKGNMLNDEGQEGVKSLVKDIVDSKLPKSNPDHFVLKGFEVLGDMYFKQIAALKYDVMCPELQRDPAFKVLRMFWKTKIL